MSQYRTILVTGFILVMACISFAEEVRVKARLVSDTKAPSAGSQFRLGVSFEIEDGWHIYWRNPGGAGLATTVDFDLPTGWFTGPLQWPLPIAFDQSEGIPGYGYEGAVVLAAEILVPADFDRSQAGTVRADVSWLACKGVCVLGSAEFESSLADLPVDPVFRKWADQLPSPSTAGDLPFGLSTTGGLGQGVLTHWLRWTGSPRVVEWFPDPSDALEIGEIRMQTRGNLTRIDAEVKPRQGASGSVDVLPSLFVITGDDGEKRGWEHSAKLTNN